MVVNSRGRVAFFTGVDGTEVQAVVAGVLPGENIPTPALVSSKLFDFGSSIY